MSSYYAHHVFFCLNRREEGRACCACHDAERLQAYAKKRIKDLGMAGEGKVRINRAGAGRASDVLVQELIQQ